MPHIEERLDKLETQITLLLRVLQEAVGPDGYPVLLRRFQEKLKEIENYNEIP